MQKRSLHHQTKKKVGTIYGHQASCNSCRRQFGFSRLASSTVEAVTPIGIELIMLSTCCEWFGACGLVSSPARPGPAQCAVCGCPSNVKRNTSLVACVLPPSWPHYPENIYWKMVKVRLRLYMRLLLVVARPVRAHFAPASIALVTSIPL